jgi:hypothetical protein
VDCSDDPYLSWASEVYCPLPMELRFANGKQLPIADPLIRQFRKNSRAAGHNVTRRASDKIFDPYSPTLAAITMTKADAPIPAPGQSVAPLPEPVGQDVTANPEQMPRTLHQSRTVRKPQ